jgi:hypothetical protein
MASSFVRRYNADDSIASFLTAGAHNHVEEILIVIDWVTVIFVGAGACTFEIVNNAPQETISLLAGKLLQITLTLDAGPTTDTAHMTFPGGLPLKQPFKVSDTELLENTSGGAPMLGGSVTLQFTGGVTTDCNAFIGYHLERASNRR